MARMSPQRQAVLDLVQREGRISPKRVGDVLGMNPSAARKLCFSMIADDQLASPTRGWYTLSDEQTLPDQDDVTETDEPREEIPVLGESPSGTYVYSHRLQAMIPRENKGYR